jgi:hypothetical protein
MDKITLTEIDQEVWRFTLYESTEKEWFVDIVYSPMNAVDLSMLIQLTSEEKLRMQDRRELMRFCDDVSKNYRDYLSRARSRNEFRFV